MDCIRSPEHFNLDVTLSAMLRRIDQRFLQHAEDGKGNLQRGMAWQIMALEVNFDFLLLGELFAEALGRRLYPQILQIRRAQSVRYQMKVGANLGHALP